jgi:hypothetical protein
MRWSVRQDYPRSRSARSWCSSVLMEHRTAEDFLALAAEPENPPPAPDVQAQEGEG